MSTPRVLIVGGGMITHDQILPAVYAMQRRGEVGEVWVCAQHGRTVRNLAAAPSIVRAFPGQSFRAFPDGSDTEQPQPELFRSVIAQLPLRQIVIVALPDQLHFKAVMTALEHDQHVICVKPLVLNARESVVIEREAFKRGLFCGVEYHKRFDDRAHKVRRYYRDGMFGEFKLGSAVLFEKWYYRHSNFQNWFTKENSDAFTYIGCHYVDLVAFITGLTPVAVSVHGIADKFPNGNEGWLWTDARVLWSNGACLNVQNALGFPDAGPGTNTQGLTLYCAGGHSGALLKHSDQYRGLEYCYTESPKGEGATQYAEPSPDYFQYIDLGTEGWVPVGYGYRSVDFIVRQILAVRERPSALAEIEAAGILATPGNSRYNERVIEAARVSIGDGGRLVRC